MPLSVGSRSSQKSIFPVTAAQPSSHPEWLIDREDKSAYRGIQYYTDNVLSPALPGTYQFIDRVLEEVAALFPSPWVHIGGDEVPEGVWLNSPKCQALMAEHGYTSSHELQGHLLRYAEQNLSHWVNAWSDGKRRTMAIKSVKIP